MNDDVERPHLAEDDVPEQAKEKFNLVTILTDSGALFLHEKSEPVVFTACDNSGRVYLDKETIELVEALKDYIGEHGGLGMSAIQLGVKKRLFVMRKPFNSQNLEVIINPKVLRGEGKASKIEGCFSIPLPDGTGVMVERKSIIYITYDTEDGTQVEDMFVGMDARIFQHEYDHLLGSLMVDSKTPTGKFKGFKRSY